MRKEIGSHFWLEPGTRQCKDIDTTIFGTEFSDCVFTASGRSAISLVLSDIAKKEKRALLPAFVCESVIEPFVARGYQLSFFDISEDFQANRESLVTTIEKAQPTVALFHNYFGFNTMSAVTDVVQQLRAQGTVVIEDTTQVLYSSFGRMQADYQVGSFRKWAGIPDGGYALKMTGGQFSGELLPQDDALVAKKVTAMEGKARYIFENIGEKQVFLDMYRKAEEHLENQEKICSMSDRSLLEQGNLDISRLKQQRRENYAYLLSCMEKLPVFAAFPQLSEDVVPLYFPVYCDKNRADIQAALREADIYAPIVWPENQWVKDLATRQYDDLLCIPCDQRYDTSDMKQIADCLADMKVK